MVEKIKKQNVIANRDVRSDEAIYQILSMGLLNLQSAAAEFRPDKSGLAMTKFVLSLRGRSVATDVVNYRAGQR